MATVVAHRGPDAHGTWVDGSVGLGHRRLAILDLSARGNQPMASQDGRYEIVFNGEIYNFRALRSALEARGETFTTTGDTEVVLSAFRRDGVASFSTLNGMFAIAIWDRHEERLVLARDRFGQKPLYLHRRAHALVFGSEIKSILATGRSPRELDWAGLHEFCWFGATLGARTLFGQIEKLLPGHHLSFDRSGATSAAFWSIENVRTRTDSVEDATARVRDLLDRAVERHLESDVPVGVFLSGGIDSSALALLAARYRGPGLATYSVSFDFDPGELARARVVATQAHANHHELNVRGTDIAEVVRTLIHHHDQPFGDAANIPLFLLARQLGGAVKVVLQGDGGDEIFAGYRRYNVLGFARAWQLAARIAPLRFLAGRRSGQRLERFLRAIGSRDAGRRMALLLTEESASRSPVRLLGAAVRDQVARTDPFARYGEFDARLRDLDVVQRMLHTDASILLPDVFCEKVDRATMAQGLEVRLPFLDTELTDYVLGLPSNYKVHRLQKKWLLRRALRGTVPDEILDAPKRGFGVPYGAWLRGPLRALMEEALLHGRSAREGLVDVVACRRAIDEHVGGRLDHGFLLYKMLELALWAEEYL